MTSRLGRLCSAGLLLSVLTSAFAQAPAGPQPQTPTPPPPLPTVPNLPADTSRPASGGPEASATEEEMVSLKLPDADIDTVLSALKIYTGKIILRPAQLPTAPGGYNLEISKPIPKSRAILYLESILAMNNIAVVPLGDEALKIVPLTSARIEAPELILDSTLGLPPSSKIASKLFVLEFLRVAELQAMIGNIVNPNLGQPQPLGNANAVLITDTISNLQRIEVLLQQVDRPTVAGTATKFYQLRNGAKASDLVNKITAIIRPIQAQLGQGTNFSADDRTNQIILITDPRQFAFFDELIERLDVRADPNTRNEVIYLRHAEAAEVAKVLINIIQGQNQVTQQSGSTRVNQPAQPTPVAPAPGGPPAAPPTPQLVSGSSSAEAGATEFSSLVTVANDERSNAIIVSGTVDDIRLLKELIDKLDIVLAQVRIDVVIAEVTLLDNNESGISSLGLRVEGDKLTGFLGSGSGFGVEGVDGDFATISRTNASGPWDLAGVIGLSSTERKDNTVILSQPSITTSHAKEANIFVGETRPVITGSVISGVGGGTTSTTTQLQIGINLKVTPLIGVDGSVQLDIEQDVDEVGPNITIDNNPQPIVFKRTTKSFVSVKSGEIIVLGGLQRQSNTKNRGRLGPIPIIGDILGPRQRRQAKTELLFFLRPHVLTNTPIDNEPAMERVDRLPQADQVREIIDPNFDPPKKSLLDRILPK